MWPLSVSDRDDFPGPSDELVAGVAAMLDDIFVAAEDAVGEPVVAHEPPDVLDRIELGRTWRQGDDGDIGGPAGLGRGVPAGLIQTTTAWASGATAPDISSGWSVMAAPLQNGGTGPAPLPSCGRMAPEI